MKKVNLLITLLVCLATSSIAQTITTFNYTGGVQTYTVPACVTSLFVDVQGAPGGMGSYSSYPQPGGRGGRVQCNIAVTPGQVLNIYVGGTGDNRHNTSSGSGTSLPGGYNGGGNGFGYYCGSGGGRSDIRIGGTAFPGNAVVVAGGGGGAGYATSSSSIGGEGGGLTGGDGWYNNSQTNYCYSGRGGAPSSGGIGATCVGAGSGTPGQGGNATTGTYAGGGGGGWYGGGAGYLGSGGGGSSYTSSTLCTNVIHTQGFNARTAGGSVTIYASPSRAFSYTGSVQTYTVPSGVTKVNLDLVGARGGHGGLSTAYAYWHYRGGAGGRVQTDLAVTPGQVLNVYVGNIGSSLTGTSSGTAAGGYNGGGMGSGGYCGGGGGMTDVRTGGTAFVANTVAVAAGGGGGAYSSTTSSTSGGDAGGLVGASGLRNGTFQACYSGTGGTQTAGGIVGTCYTGTHPSGVGTQGQGGNGGGSNYVGGGGAGWWGGGCAGYFGGGGGGSSYTKPSVTQNATHTMGYNFSAGGQGSAIITPLYPMANVSPASLAFGAVTNGGTSSPLAFAITAANLQSDGSLTITPPANFEVSVDGGITWGTNSSPSSYTYTSSDFTLGVLARFKPTAITSYSGNIVVSGGGMSCSVNTPVTGTGANACSGTPTAGSATINGLSSTSGNSSTAFTLNVPSATIGGGITYQWQVSTTSSSTGFTDIPGGISASYVYTGLMANSWFKCIVTCGSNTATSSTVSATFSLPSSSCIPNSFTNCTGCGFYVSNGSSYPCIITGASGNISDASVAISGTGGSAYYYNNISQSVRFNPGSNYACTAGGLTTNPISYSVWIDFDNNGSFDNSTELIGGVGNYNISSTRATFPLPIKATAVPGAYRMRVAMQYSANYAPGANTGYPTYPLMNPCPGNSSTNVYYADTRDYTAIINAPSPALTASAVGNVGTVLVNTNSVPVTVTKLNGTGLLPAIGLLTVTAPSNFTVSIDGVSWASSVTVPYNGGAVSDKNVYIRFSPTAVTTYSGNVTISGGGISSTINVAVSGTGNASLCSAAPTAGTPTITPTSGNANTVFTLGLTGTTAIAGLYYQWQTSPNGTTWTNIPSAIAPTYSFSGLTGTTFFRCIVSCISGASSTTSSVSATYSASIASSSCVPNSFTNCTGCGFYVSNGSSYPCTITGATGNISDISTAIAGTGGSSYYYNNVSQSATFIAGNTYSCTAGGLTTNAISYSVWIDFNSNGSFDNATELVGGVANYSNSSTRATFPLNIPATAPSGSFRMRVVMNYSANYAPGANTGYPTYPLQNPCPGNSSTNVYYADTRDYTAVVKGGCAGAPNAGVVSAAPLSSCSAFVAEAFNVGITRADGISLQWQSSTSPTSGFTNISGATNAYYKPSLSSVGTIYYRTNVTCANSGMSSVSPSQPFTYLAQPPAIGGPLSLCHGTSGTLTNATSGGTWSSSNTSVATIGPSSGVVTTVSVGTWICTYTAPSGCQITAVCTVNPTPSAITGAAAICGGTGATTVTLASASTGGTWTSGNVGQATIGSASGIVTGVGNGNPVMTYTMPGGCFTTTVMTVNAVPAITGNSSVCIGFTLACGNPLPGGTWSSSNPAVATINSSGLLTSVSVGSTVISYTLASAGGCSATKTIFVTNPPVAYNVTGGGGYCSGGTGVNVGLSNSNVGISYFIYNGATQVAGPIAGIGGAMDFGKFTAAGTYGVVANPGTPCALNMIGTVTINVNPLPTAFSVTGGGNYCTGGTGVHVYLSSSTIGVNYQLMMGTTPVGAPVPGTGASIDFGLFTSAGTYTVAAVNASNGCANNMSGSVTIGLNPLPAPFSVTGGGGYCVGGTGVRVFLSGSATGINYQLTRGGSNVGTPLAGTGASLDFGLQTVAGNYSVVATDATTGCVANMSGSATVIVNPLPTVFNVTGGGSYCSGGTGVSVGLNGSTAGVNYQLYNGATLVSGGLMAGTGTSISFGSLTTVGTYTVVATNASTGCVNNMAGNATISIDALPTAFSVTGGGNYCAGGAGLPVGLASSQAGTNYQLYCNGLLVGAGSGSGGPINFGIQYTAGVYTVVATNPATGCINNMAGSVTITINPLPTVFTVTQTAVSYCDGGTGVGIGLNGSTTGVNYQLYLAGVPVGTPVAGTGSTISFGLKTAAGVYTVVAVNPTTTCTMNMAGSASVIINPTPAVYIVAGGGSYCAGGTGLPVNLSSSDVGISYQLKNGSTSVGGPLAGTGSGLSFGVISAGGAYTVVATNPATGCTKNMSGSAAVVVNTLPSAFALSGGGNYCTGMAGVPVGLTGSSAGVNYQLYKGSTAVGTVVPGTGSDITFGPQTAAGSYTVIATNATTGCTNNMTGSVTVGVNPLPTVFGVTGGGNYCSGGTGVNVGLGGSAAGLNYQLMNGSSTVGTSVLGTGAALSFGLQTASGTYTVVAYDPSTGCSNTMAGSTIVNATPLPAAFTVTGGGNYCAGGTGVPVGLGGSSSGVSYQLYAGSVASGAPVAGTGAPLAFGLQTTAGNYTVIATGTATGCAATMTGSAAVAISTLPVLRTVTGGGNYCLGGTGVNIGLDGSTTGTTYQLYNGATAVGAAVPGSTGSPINFGLQTAVGIYTVVAINGSLSCSNNMTGSAVVGINPLPTVYSVTGGGNYCVGDAGVPVGLSGSNSGVIYQLMNGSSLVGGAIPGTGGPVSFGIQTTAGNYTVVATVPATGCTNNMAGSAVVAISPLPVLQTVTGGGNYCDGGTGVNVGLASSVVGTMYQLLNGGAPVGAPIPGTGSSLDFGLETAAGVYTVIATTTSSSCTNTMTGSVSVSIDPLPTVYNVIGGGNFCTGGAGVTVGITSSDPGVMYQLMRSSAAVGAPVAGTGSALDFGLQTVVGSYTVVATNAVTSCVNSMSGSVTVAANPLPAAYTVGGGGNYCSGGAGLAVTLSSSETGVSYQLLNSGLPVGLPMYGTGSALDFGLQTAGGSYTVEATNTATYCTSMMTGSVAINVNPLPNTYAVNSSGTAYCAGGAGINVWITNSEIGTTYQLYNSGSPIGASRSGTGSSVDFGNQFAAGNYTVVATNATTGCSRNMTGAANVVVNAVPSAFTVTGGGSYCAGGTGVNVGLSGSNAGVNYQLKRDGTPVGSMVLGSSGPVSFGLQTTPGVYTIEATNPATTCVNNMSGAAAVSVTTAPALFTVGGGGNYCAGGTGVNVTLTGSVSGVNYQLFRNGLTTVGGPVAGTGAALNFGAQTTAGNYTVVATSASGGCSGPMAGNATVGINAAPAVFPVIGGGNYCAGGAGVHIGISGSGIAASYTLYKGGVPVGSPMLGTGSGIDFGLQTAAGTYTVIASDNTTACTNTMSGTAAIAVNALPAAFAVVGGGNYCAGGAGVHVGLSNSATGVNYTLYRGFTAVTAKAGTGSPLDFGTQTAAGTYTVLATNAATGCQATMTGDVSVVINPLVTPSVAISTSTGDTICQGTVVTYTAAITNGGSAPAFLWTVNGVTAGVGSSYSYVPANGDVVGVTLTSSATCATPASVSNSMTMTVDPNKVPEVAISANPGILVCQGANVTYTASAAFGGTAPVYSWMKNGVASGTSSTFSYVPGNGDVVYCVMTSNYHCRITNTATSPQLTMDVAAPVLPSVSVSANPGSNIAAGQSVTFTAAAANAGPTPSYQWLVNGAAISGATLATFSTSDLANNDSVTCQVLSSGGCAGLLGKGGMRVHVYGVGVQQVGIAGADIRLVPNPNKGIFTVKGTLGVTTDEDVAMEVTNMLGQVIYKSNVQARNGEINERIELGRNIANGMYILSLRSGGENKVFHLIIEQ